MPDDSPQLRPDEPALVTLGFDFRVPATFTVPNVPVPERELPGGVRADLSVEVIDGKAILSSVRFDPAQDSKDWGRVDLPRLLATALAAYAYLQSGDELPTLDVLRIADDAIGATRKHNRWSPIVAQRVADWYEQGGASLVATHMRVTRRQADRYIARARQEGAIT